MKVKVLPIGILSPAFSNLPCIAQGIITTPSLLKELTSFKSVATWPQPSFIMKQSSSYDRRSVAVDKPGWFANGDLNEFIRKEQKKKHTGYVMMDAGGPGVVVRCWLTTVIKKI